MPITPEALYIQLGQFITEMPDLRNHGWNNPEGQRWLGRATVLVEAAGDLVDALNFKTTAQNLSSNPYIPGHDAAVQRMTAILYRALARAEMEAPAALRNSFIPTGEPYTALSAVGRALGDASQSIFIIDPYADANLLDEYVLQAREGVSIRILADTKGVKPGLLPAMQRWIAQFSAARPLEVRLAPARTLHDRLIILDNATAWSIGQSFNALAARSPTAIVRFDQETAAMKVAAYDQLWATSPALT
ncbi:MULTISPECIES: phosphatidylserine/phosphatidylglycerophosphate/cardiolipin synthase family protein [Pseudomonas]|jgi:phosphatidylserine/phosphatidylglycerophosphate/cardiolipin synthase-like enzyme|uniref:phosphatidylserine/phosphatidylglycerophosphate/ cardiolipin synthase family protein n=1 Tax=Pseudomonas TaxID=286 RepID=UPI000F007B11|nr:MULTISPECIES: phosphatidylserine/phosphatidylglycerophosphate/cardiolipin synthase family protein [Pseudomonas]MBD8575389.1 phosphatidylserine/phosphatidylglycerophosphate/cardiolipin synthase family protein [Pseudomonas syringae]